MSRPKSKRYGGAPAPRFALPFSGNFRGPPTFNRRLNSVYLGLGGWYNREWGLKDRAVSLLPGGREGPRPEVPGEVYPEMRAPWIGAMAAAALSLPASADEVVLRNGAVFGGIVREDGEKVVLEIDCGTMTFRRSEVREVRRTEDPLKELDRKASEVKDAPGYYELGRWARKNGLTTRANELFQKAVALDPDHEGARLALGHQKHEGRWLAEDEAMAARGYVRHEGRWLKRETVEFLEEQANRARMEADRQAAAERIARMKREVEMERLALEREKIERNCWRFGIPWWGGFSVAYPLRPVPPKARPHPAGKDPRREEDKPGDGPRKAPR